jgi:hypothetical protein
LNKKITIPTILAVSIFAIAIASFSPINVLAEYGDYKIPEISGSIAVNDSDYAGLEEISLADAMTIAQDSVDDSNAMWGKLQVVQGYLVYKVGVLSDDDMYYKVIVDAGDGAVLYVSDGKSKDSWKHSDKSGKWKDHYADLTPEERELKMKQWGEVKEAFFALSIDERAKMIMHFMSMKVQWEGLSEEQIEQKKLEMKQMMEELLPLSVEEKTEKLREYVNSL